MKLLFSWFDEYFQWERISRFSTLCWINCQNHTSTKLSQWQFWQFHAKIWLLEKFSSILYTVLWKHIVYVDWLSLNAFLLAKFASSIDCSPDLALPLELKIIDKAANTTITIKMVLRTILPFALALSISELLKNKIFIEYCWF